MIINTFSRPRLFPAAAPFGPVCKQTHDDFVTNPLALMGSPSHEVVSELALGWYRHMEVELRRSYGGESADDPLFLGRADPFEMKKRPLVESSPGVSGHSVVASFLRRVSARLSEFVSIRRVVPRPAHLTDQMHCIRRRLQWACLPTGDSGHMVWAVWRNIVNFGLDYQPEWKLKCIMSIMLRDANELDGKAGLRRSGGFTSWARKNAPGEVVLFKWLKDKPPFVSAPCANDLSIIGYSSQLVSKARVFTDVWEDGDCVASAVPSKASRAIAALSARSRCCSACGGGGGGGGGGGTRC